MTTPDRDPDLPPPWIQWRDRLHDDEPLSAEDQRRLRIFFDGMVEAMAELFVFSGAAKAVVEEREACATIVDLVRYSAEDDAARSDSAEAKTTACLCAGLAAAIRARARAQT